jgi:hypothetical protein
LPKVARLLAGLSVYLPALIGIQQASQPLRDRRSHEPTGHHLPFRLRRLLAQHVCHAATAGDFVLLGLHVESLSLRGRG